MAEYVFLAIRNAINKFMRHSRNNVTYTVFKSSNKRYLSILIMLDHLWCISEYDIVAATFWEHCYIFLYKVLYGSNYSSTSLRNTFSSNIYPRYLITSLYIFMHPSFGFLSVLLHIHIIWFWKDIYRPCIQWVLYSKNEKPMKRLFFHIFYNKECCRRGSSRTRKIYNHLKRNIFSIHTLFNKILKKFKRSFFVTF